MAQVLTELAVVVAAVVALLILPVNESPSFHRVVYLAPSNMKLSVDHAATLRTLALQVGGRRNRQLTSGTFTNRRSQ